MNYRNDIQIAVDSIHSLKLDSIFNINDCICDLYCVPSHSDYAYYARIYEVSGMYRAVYARTEINDIFRHTIYCSSFESALEADRHSAKTGRIICGYFNPSDELVDRLLSMKELFPKEDVISDDRNIIIDGVWQIIRIWKNGSPENTVSFEDMSAQKIFKKEFSDIVCNMNQLIECEIRKK